MSDGRSSADTPPEPQAIPGTASREGTSWPTVRRLGPDGRYHLEETIASGGAATVWRAYDEQLDRSVAIKILHPHLVGDEDTVRRFERESRNAARLHHPNAIQIYDSGRVNDVVYLVMEYVDGPTLKQVLRDHGALADWTVVAAIGEQIAAALAEAHSQSLIHRDIKPANILFTSEGIVKVVDFGIAKALTGATTDLTAEGTTVGTATYIAPEQYTGAEIDGRADIYALGMVMYECLTGRPAFSGDTPTATAAARLTREILPPRQVRADVDRRLEDVIVRCARRDPNERFNDVSAVAHALRGLNNSIEPHELTRDLVAADPPDEPSLPDMPIVDPDAETDPGMPAGSGRGRLRMALAFLAGMALTAVAVMALTTSGRGPLVENPDTTPGSLRVQDAGSYDPWARDGENDEEVGFAHDGDPTTMWQTELYRGGMQKPGVGLWFELGDQPVSNIIPQFTKEDVGFELYYAEGPIELPTGGNPAEDFTAVWERVGRYEATESSWPVTLEEPQAHRYWLLWLTDLPESRDGTGERVGVLDVHFNGPINATTTPATAPEDAG